MKYCNSCEWFEYGDYALCPYSSTCTMETFGERPTRYKPKEEKNNKVEHPKHYNRENAMECIDEMVLLFGKEEAATFCKLNAWKYRYRAADKNGEEDLKKSDEYIKKYKELKNYCFISPLVLTDREKLDYTE